MNMGAYYSERHFITPCTYSEIVMPIEVCLLGYTVHSWTIACNNFDELMCNSTLNSRYYKIW